MHACMALSVPSSRYASATAEAGPCTADISQFEATVRQSARKNSEKHASDGHDPHRWSALLGRPARVDDANPIEAGRLRDGSPICISGV